MLQKVSEGGLGWSARLDCMKLLKCHAHTREHLHLEEVCCMNSGSMLTNVLSGAEKIQLATFGTMAANLIPFRFEHPTCPQSPATISDTRALRKDKYDEDLEQFWCEKRTIGQQGTNEIEGLKEKVSGSGQSSSLNISGLQGNLDREWDRDGREGCAQEAPKKAATVAFDMTHECN